MTFASGAFDTVVRAWCADRSARRDQPGNAMPVIQSRGRSARNDIARMGDCDAWPSHLLSLVDLIAGDQELITGTPSSAPLTLVWLSEYVI